MTSFNWGKNENESTEKAPKVVLNVEMQRPQNCLVHGTHALILRVSRYAGLAPLRFERHARGWVVSLSKGMLLYSYVLVTALTVNTLLAIFQDMSLKMEYAVRMNSSLGRGVALVDLLIIIMTVCVGAYAAPARMRNMMRFVSTLTEIDHRLDLRPCPLVDRKIVMFGWVFLCYIVAFVIADYWYQVQQSSQLHRCYIVAYQYLGFYILYVGAMIVVLQFAFTTLTVLARFRALNDALQHTAKQVGVEVETDERSSSKVFARTMNAPGSVQHQNINVVMVNATTNLVDPAVIIRHHIGGSSRLLVSPSEAVRRLTALYDALCDVVHVVDASYSLPLLVVLLSILLHLIVSPYYLVVELVKTEPRPLYAAMQTFWCVNHAIRMFMIVEPCYRTKMEIYRTVRILSRLATSVQDRPLCAQVEIFTRQLFLRSAIYSPMGICVLDRPLMASIIGAVTTYLVILIQFQTNSD